MLGSDNPLKVNTVRLKNVKTGALSERKVDGVFIAIGHTPASELFVGQLEMKAVGLHRHQRLFDRHVGPGRVRRRRRHRRHVYRQAVTAAGQGCMAALEAEKFLHAQEHKDAHADTSARRNRNG